MKDLPMSASDRRKLQDICEEILSHPAHNHQSVGFHEGCQRCAEAAKEGQDHEG